jgi:effector-binding domain-containing protein
MRHPLIALPLRNQEQSPSILTLPRQDIYFSGSRKELKKQYHEIVNDIKSANCLYVGLSLAGEAWEYPLWVLLQQNYSPVVKIIHLGINNISQQIPPAIPVDRVCKIVQLS